jgi:hypothetical protein
VVDPHAGWMDLEAQLRLRARASPWSPLVDGAPCERCRRARVWLDPCTAWVEGDPSVRRSPAPSVRRCVVGCRCSPLWVDPEPPLATARSGIVVTMRRRTTAAAAPWRRAWVGLCQGAARRRRVHPSAGARTGERAHDSDVAR